MQSCSHLYPSDNLNKISRGDEKLAGMGREEGKGLLDYISLNTELGVPKSGKDE